MKPLLFSIIGVCVVLSPARAGEDAYLKAASALNNKGNLGWSVGVSGDTVVVGSPFDDSGAVGVNGSPNSTSAPDSGAAYVYVRSGSSWVQQAYLKASNAEANDQFGSAVAISGDTIVIGAANEGSSANVVDGNQLNNNAPLAGAAYVFVRNGTSWTQQAYLKASNAELFDEFGTSIAVSQDTVVVGAYRESSSSSGVGGNQLDNSAGFAGAAYVFRRSGATWIQEAYLKGSGLPARFGGSVSVSGDTAVVGAEGEGSTGSGAAYVFQRSGSTWTSSAQMLASNPGAGDAFGCSVGVDGDTVVVGAFKERSSAIEVDGDQTDDSAADRGAAYVFSRSGGSWSQTAYLKPYTSPANLFGKSVAVSGNKVLVGASSDPNHLGWTGAAYVFATDGSKWAPQAYLWPSHGDDNDQFGWAADISGETVVVGARLEASSATGVNGDPTDNNSAGSGAAYVYGVGQPWAHLGHAKGGQCGFPLLTVDADLTPGSPGEITLLSACGSAPALLLIGLGQGNQQVLGGTLIPNPIATQLLLTVASDGSIQLPFVWPSGVPAGTNVYLQYLIHDAVVTGGTPGGVAFSNGVELIAQ